MANPIKLGIVGIGRAGYGMHCPELRDKKDKFTIVAACDIIPERTEKMNKEYGCKTYDNIEDLLKDDEIEMVAIATRSCDHFKHAVMALNAGKSIVLEKPMCRTYKEALELKALVEKLNGPKIYARHNRRFEVNFQKIKEIIASGILGNVFEIRIARDSYSRRDDWQTLSEFGGGQLLNWGPHIIDQSLRLLDSPVKKLYSDLKHTVAAGDCEDHLTITFIGENDRTVRMQISGGMCMPTPQYEVFGTKGALKVEDDGRMVAKYIDPEQKLAPPVANPGTPGQTFGKSGTFAGKEEIRWIETTIDKERQNLSVIWNYVYESFREGKEYPISLDEAISVIEVIDKVKQGTQFK